MSRSRRTDRALTVRESFDNINLDNLRPLSVLLVNDPPKKKADLIPLFGKEMTNPDRVRALYEKLDDLSKNAVRMATHHPQGELDIGQFVARYGSKPQFDTGGSKRDRWNLSYQEQKKIKPTILELFLPDHKWLPTDLRQLLLAFVPALEAFVIPSREETPTQAKCSDREYTSKGYVTNEWEVPVRIREMALDAEADVRAVLRLIDAGKVRVTDKKHLPTEASQKAVAAVLSGGDFYSDDDYAEEDFWDDADISIKPFAWPMLIAAGELAEKRGDKLKLTSAGKQALTAPAHETIRKLWRAWLKSRDFDEFTRVEAIRGQGKGAMSAVVDRRKEIVAALRDCPPGRWFSIEDFWRFMIATDRNFVVSHNQFNLYIAEHYYGALGDASWDMLEGRYALVFLLEYAATLGLLDVGLIPPFGARSDYRGQWGTDDLPFLSRYDGLMFLRINPLGAWCLGQTPTYTPPTRPKLANLRVLANMDIVAEPSLAAGDRLTLDKFAEKTSERVWHLSTTQIVAALENGSTLGELREFLANHTVDEIPATVTTFLADIEQRATRFTDEGPARVIACADGILAAEILAEPKLKGKCRLADSRFLVVREADLPVLKAAFRKLGYIWPIRDE